MADIINDIIRENSGRINDWIDDILYKHRDIMIPVAQFNFRRLPLFFGAGLLGSASAVPVKENPPIPMGLFPGEIEFLAEYLEGSIAAITYKNTYFVRGDFLNDESLHFHELVHVVQWDHLGHERMLYYYVLGLIESGYRNSFLEDMAFSRQKKFESKCAPYDVEASVRKELEEFQRKNSAKKNS